MSKKFKNKKPITKTAIIAVLSLGIVGTAFAYFTSQAEQKNNEFNIVKSDGIIEIEEPEWDPDPGKDMTPGMIIDKDPRTVSHVDYDGWVVMRIEVPKISATLNGENGRFDAVKLLEIDTDNFELLATESTDKSSVYYYGYKDIVLSEAHGKDIESGKVVQEGEAKVYMNMTTPVFNKIQVQDFTAIADSFKSSVDVDAQIIQRVDPSTGKDFLNVSDAFKTMGNFGPGTKIIEEPVNPTEPTIPGNPSEPTEPNNPTEPTNPSEPTDPSEITEPIASTAGLYDENDNLIASWDELVNTYGLDIESNKTSSTGNSIISILAKPSLNEGKKLVISNKTTKIGDYTFYLCQNLTSIIIPNSVNTIGKHAFERCNNLTSIIIPESVVSIGEQAFHYCYGLTSVTFKGSTNIGDNVFNTCLNLKSISLNGVTSISDCAFYCCSSLTSITIPDSVTSIGSMAFDNCLNLTSVTIPDSVTSIGSMAFQDTKLTSVTIPSNIKSIGRAAFNSSSLSSITYQETTYYNNNNDRIALNKKLMSEGVEGSDVWIPAIYN